MAIPVRVEYAHQRKMRTRNTRRYRAAHWPIWIWVFFLAPGPLTFDLFARGGSVRNLLWLSTVLVCTGVAALFGKLPGAEPAPYILRFTEDRPNPLYRRICYTFAWNALLNFALLNLAGLIGAVATGRWRMKQIYASGYTPLLIVIILLSVFGVLPRVRRSTQGEGWERRSFYGTVWSVTAAQSDPAASLEDPAEEPCHRSRQAGRLLRRSAAGGHSRRLWPAATHPAHPARRADGRRLATAPLTESL